MDDYDDERDPIWPILLAVGAILVFIIGIVVFLVVLFSSGGSGDDRPQASLPVTSSEESPDPDGEEAVIPEDIVNTELRMAKYRLDQLGIEYEEVEDYSNSVTEGRIIKTIPGPGETVKKGTKITLVKSKGPQPVAMVSLVGEKETDAIRKLRSLDLEIGEVIREPSDLPEGQVFKHSPDVGDEIPEGTEVNLWVSTGPEASASPSAEPSPSHGGQPSGIPVESSSPATSHPPASEPPVSEPPAQPPARQKAIYVLRPSGLADGESVQVRIEVDGQVAYNATVESHVFPISPLVSGRGQQEITVYIDGELKERYKETFS